MTDTDATADAEPSATELPDALLLTPVQFAFCCLIEKEATTPDQYPLTENALTLACNQKTSRSGHGSECRAGRACVARAGAAPAGTQSTLHACAALGTSLRAGIRGYAQQQAALCVDAARAADSGRNPRPYRTHWPLLPTPNRYAIRWNVWQRSPALRSCCCVRPGSARTAGYTCCAASGCRSTDGCGRAPAHPRRRQVAPPALLARLDALEERLAALEARLDPELTGPAPPDIQNP